MASGLTESYLNESNTLLTHPPPCLLETLDCNHELPIGVIVSSSRKALITQLAKDHGTNICIRKDVMYSLCTSGNEDIKFSFEGNFKKSFVSGRDAALRPLRDMWI